MKTIGELQLLPDTIETESLYIAWYSNGQMWSYAEVKDGEWHGEVKHYRFDGELRLHRIYENGEWVKEIV